MSQSLDTLVRHLARRLQEPLPGPESQRRFAPRPLMSGWSPEQTPDTARRAAVLLLLYPGPDGPAMPLTVRPATMAAHAGQVSLPGGALYPGESVDAAALREADEEIGIPPASVEVIGTLSTLWVAVSNFVLTPVVGVARDAPTFRLHEREVDSLIEMPVDRLLDRKTVGWHTLQRGSTRIDYPGFDIGGHVVWGATAMVLSEFGCLFDPDYAPGAGYPPHPAQPG